MTIGPFQRSPRSAKNRQGRQGFPKVLSDSFPGVQVAWDWDDRNMESVIMGL